MEVVADYTYLDVKFRPSGLFRSACTRLVGQAKRALFMLRTICNQRSVKIALHLFESLVVPILAYGGEACGPFFVKDWVDAFEYSCDTFESETIAIKFYKSI